MPTKQAKRRTMNWKRGGRPVSSRVPLGAPLQMVNYRTRFPPQIVRLSGGSKYQVWAEEQLGQEVPSVIKPANTRPEARKIAEELGETYPYVHIVKTTAAWALYRGGKHLESAFSIIVTDPKDIASRLIEEDEKILRQLGFTEGKDFYPYLGAPRENWDRYQEAVKQMLGRLGYGWSVKVPVQVRDMFENENYHSLNAVLDFTGYGEPNPNSEGGRYDVEPEAFFSREVYLKGGKK